MAGVTVSNLRHGAPVARWLAELLGAAVSDCSPKLQAASAEGYETILLIEPFWLGSVDSWQTAFADLKTAGALDDFPASVFAVSFTDGVARMR